jgi:glyoxylase-like metal-dependent hydrolase (beta-lactamase superfamily II)
LPLLFRWQVHDLGGGLRIVATPGHTPGHVSLLHEPTAALINGYALINQLRPRRVGVEPAGWESGDRPSTAGCFGLVSGDMRSLRS